MGERGGEIRCQFMEGEIRIIQGRKYGVSTGGNPGQFGGNPVSVQGEIRCQFMGEIRCQFMGKFGVLQPIMPLDLPVKVRPWELTVYPRSHIRR